MPGLDAKSSLWTFVKGNKSFSAQTIKVVGSIEVVCNVAMKAKERLVSKATTMYYYYY